MTTKQVRDIGGKLVDHIDLTCDGINAHHAIPHQNKAGGKANASDYITAKEAAELAGESLSWVHGMANRGFIDAAGFNGKCLFSAVDVEKLIQEKEKEKRR